MLATLARTACSGLMPCAVSLWQSASVSSCSGPRAGTQQDLLVGQAVPRRTVRVHARERAGDRAAVGERLVAAAQPVERLHARETDERGIALEREFAQALQRVLARLPRSGRIDDEQRAVVAAELRRDEQHAGPDVAIARRRRHADEMQVLDVAQREQAGAAFGRADQVVVGERRAVVAVGIRIDVTDRVTRAGAERAVRTRVRHGAAHPHQQGFLQRRDDESRRARFGRQPPENFLVLDVLGAERAHALHDEVEAVFLVGRDVVVVDGGTQHFARAGTQRFEHQLFVAARQADGGRRAAVHDAHDDGFAAAVVEELLDGIGQHARLPEPAEHLLVLGEIAHAHRTVDGTAQRTADEPRRRRRQANDRLVCANRFRHRDATVGNIAQSRAPPRKICLKVPQLIGLRSDPDPNGWWSRSSSGCDRRGRLAATAAAQRELSYWAPGADRCARQRSANQRNPTSPRAIGPVSSASSARQPLLHAREQARVGRERLAPHALMRVTQQAHLAARIGRRVAQLAQRAVTGGARQDLQDGQAVRRELQQQVRPEVDVFGARRGRTAWSSSNWRYMRDDHVSPTAPVAISAVARSASPSPRSNTSGPNRRGFRTGRAMSKCAVSSMCSQASFQSAAQGVARGSITRRIDVRSGQAPATESSTCSTASRGVSKATKTRPRHWATWSGCSE